MSSQNPYEAPQAPVADYVAADTGGGFVAQPRACEAGAGARWISEGWAIFALNPGVWIGVCVLWALFAMAVSLFVPFLGQIAANVLFPVIAGGLMLGCDALRRGQPLTVAHLFAGFNANGPQLMMVGVLGFAASLAIMLAVFLPAIGVAGFAAFTGNQSPDALASLALPLMLGGLVVMALMLPLAMAMWFAPALVALNGLGAIEAMKLSFFACLKNVVPYLLWSVLAIVIAVVASIPLLLGWLVAWPVMFASIYASYRDIFYPA